MATKTTKEGHMTILKKIIEREDTRTDFCNAFDSYDWFDSDFAADISQLLNEQKLVNKERT